MTEDGFPDDQLTLLVLQDVTLFGNSEELKEFDRGLVRATRDRLLQDKYAVIDRPKKGKGGPLRGDDTIVEQGPGRARLLPKGKELSSRLERKLRN